MCAGLSLAILLLPVSDHLLVSNWVLCWSRRFKQLYSPSLYLNLGGQLEAGFNLAPLSLRIFSDPFHILSPEMWKDFLYPDSGVQE